MISLVNEIQNMALLVQIILGNFVVVIKVRFRLSKDLKKTKFEGGQGLSGRASKITFLRLPLDKQYVC